MADEHLINSGLNYLILRPGSLTDGNASERYTNERPKNKDDAVISRSNVAHALLYAVANKASTNQIVELFDGKEGLGSILKKLSR